MYSPGAGNKINLSASRFLLFEKSKYDIINIIIRNIVSFFKNVEQRGGENESLK